MSSEVIKLSFISSTAIASLGWSSLTEFVGQKHTLSTAAASASMQMPRVVLVYP